MKKKFNTKKFNTHGGIIFKIIFFCLIVFFAGETFVLSAGNALALGSLENMDIAGYADQMAVQTSDKGQHGLQAKTWYEKMADWIEEKAINEAKYLKEVAFGRAAKQAFSAFLNQFAYDTATYLATGDKGQSPMFQTDSFGEYMRNAVDNAAGTWLEILGREGPIKFNLCQPSYGLVPKIGLGLAWDYRPEKPECTFSQMKQRWSEELKSPNFLSKFQTMFNPWENDIGITLNLYDLHRQYVLNRSKEADKNYPQAQPFKNVTEPISGKVKTPGAVVEQFSLSTVIGSILENTPLAQEDEVNAALKIFFNTLISKLMQKWLHKGLVTHFPDNSYKGNWGGFSDYSGSGYAGGGISGAKERFRRLIEPEFGTRGDYNILNELVSCPDPHKAGPTNCVITDNFRRAVSDRLTVAQAIEQGYLDADGIFGFNADGLEPSYLEGYPYRSMIILRKFRILPVGWELAAQFIKDHPGQNNPPVSPGSDGAKNLADLVACFDDTDQYDGYYADWCRGLVDPNWVLKAPLNYCKREGPGPEIISQRVTGRGKDSVLAVSRNDNYCADEQSCIQENNDGSCRLYGYCTEERRTWDFNSQSCDSKFNTCETFRGRDGQTDSFLKNTLDYGSCGFNNVGCQDYCEEYDYGNNQFICTAISGDKLFLNKNAEKCEAQDEGCHEFIRTRPGVGANLLVNSDFEDESNLWPEIAAVGTITGAESYSGVNSLSLSGDLTKTVIVGPSGYSIANQAYTLSLYARGCAFGDYLELNSLVGGTIATTSLFNNSGEWQRYVVSQTVPGGASGNSLSFAIHTASCLIDAVKLERGVLATPYGNYRDNGLVYIKSAPSYLGCSGANPPSRCDDFARACGQDEVGCDFYTAVGTGMTIPAKTEAPDYCPSECVGYKEYLQSETGYDFARPAYFIPKTAKSCGAQSVGCDEFTNLDKLTQGGEAREYYTYLRRCNKPSVSSNCTEFYTWEGSDEAGYQLKVYPLAQDSAGAPEMLPGYILSDCTEAIYNLDPSDPAYNPDCRQFYSRSGDVYYRLYSWTITCSEDCHPYRRRDRNYDPTISNQASCAAGNRCDQAASDGDEGCWDVSVSRCVICKNGGYWDHQHGACIYEAVPSESKQCAATQAGCREYSGSRGANMRIIFHSDFEGSRQGWTGLGGTVAELSSESLFAGGNSLFASTSPYDIGLLVGGQVQEGRAYTLRFVAKAVFGPVGLTVSLDNGTANVSFTGGVSLNTAGWDIYELNLSNLDHEASSTETLIISGDGAFYIDDIRLTEIRDRYYLIKNSWETPRSCDEDIYGGPWPQYMLNCDIYSDQDGRTHYLRRFSKLCQESAVGCELMIDTHNYSGYNAEAWNDLNSDDMCSAADDNDCEAVPDDNFVYMVYNPDKSCGVDKKGCQLAGDPEHYESYILYRPVYIKNNPDVYNNILCTVDGQGCEEWTFGGETAYFKDPGNQVCQWRQAQSTGGGGWGWYKKQIKRCDSFPAFAGDGQITPGVEVAPCLNNDDCGTSTNCILDTNDYSCPTDAGSPPAPKTIGVGGIGNRVVQPAPDVAGNNWVGLCPSDQSGCSEYIDPVSRFSGNILYNADFSQDVDTDSLADGWSSAGAQTVKLESNTLYILAVEGVNTVTVRTTSGADIFYILNGNNILSAAVNTASITSGASGRISIRFYADAGASGEQIEVGVGDSSLANGSRVELKKAVISYQLEQETDKQACNGVVDFDRGCVLFNERAQDGASLADLKWDSDLTINDADGVPPQAGTAGQDDANMLLKVAPNRICNKWLACRSFIKDEHGNNVCFDVGLCDSVDDNGNCNDFIISGQNNQTYAGPASAGAFADLSGYVKAGYGLNSLQADYLPLGAMEQEGEVAQLANGGFELAGSNGYPLGWFVRSESWNENVFTVIDNPVDTQTECLNKNCSYYVPEGRNFLKVGSTHIAESDFVDVVGNAPYILSAFINTKNLQEGRAKIAVQQFDSQGSPLNTPQEVLSQNRSLGWQAQLSGFQTLPGASRIKIRLYSSSGLPTGNFYYDDINIKPALYDRNEPPLSTPQYAPQTCRLYPETDALSCEYYEDSGTRRKGWLGYCLEYDRYPGSPNTCLLWYPIDKVKGEGIEEGAGYHSKTPVYYCLSGTTRRVYEYRHSFWKGDGNWDHYPDPGTWCPAGYTSRSIRLWKRRGSDHIRVNCIPDGSGLVISDGSENSYVNTHPTSETDGWYPYNGVLTTFYDGYGSTGFSYTINNSNPYVKYLCDGALSCTISQEPFRSSLSCEKVVQTVSSVGQNKYWSGRVYDGSDYRVPVLGIVYDDDSKPFGSIFPGGDSWAYVSNPFEWDGNPKIDGLQPLEIQSPTDGARAGQIYNCRGSIADCRYVIDNFAVSNYPYAYIDNSDFIGVVGSELVKRIFAKSYGVWRWDGSHYNSEDGADWGPPENLCDDGAGNNIRATYNPSTMQCGGGDCFACSPMTPTCDYCAVLPTVDGIRVNNNNNPYNYINKTDFINLTFRSNVNSQQLPMVLYAVDWGDNEITVVSGVEMHDRPTWDSPHSLYHLYSYWDMKAKHSVNQGAGRNTIYCGQAGNSTASNNTGGTIILSTAPGSDYCLAKPRMKIKDNWGWCNAGAETLNGAIVNPTGIDDCNQWAEFGGWVVVLKD